jgi:membrane dipeptidase
VFNQSLRLISREMDENAQTIRLCRTAAEAKNAFASGLSAAFFSIEGAHVINCDAALLEKAFSFGIRSLCLTWNNANIICGSHSDDAQRGLSGQGRDFVRRLNELGVIIDLSHCSDPGFWDACDISSSPVIASHSNSRSVYAHSRNLTDSQFKAIIEKNGVAGVNLYADILGGAADIPQLMKHIMHFLDLGGEKHISLGTDFDGCRSLCRGIEGIQDLPRIYDAMLAMRIPEAVVQDIFFNNLMRVVEEVCVM